jgi:bacterioferritin-associated ferredoxin
MSKRLVCLCNMVTEKEIHAALTKGARKTSEIQKTTRAGTSCGRCLVWIDSIVEEFINNLPEESQQRIDFED